jgi:hypothetical protein
MIHVGAMQMKVGDAFRILRNTSYYSYPLWISGHGERAVCVFSRL